MDRMIERKETVVPCNPSLSVVVPTKNRQEILKGLISSFVGQELDSYIEFLIIDQSQTQIDEQQLAILKSLVNCIGCGSVLKYYHKPELSGLTAAKNFGIDQAIGEIILFLDDDVVLLPGFLNELLSGIEHGFDGVSGVQIQDSSNKSKMSEIYSTIFQRGYLRDRRRYINRNFNRLPRYVSSQVLSGGLTAYRRDLLISERFDTNLVSYCLGEDKEYSLRVSVKGAKLAICTKALAFHFRHPEGKPNPIERHEAKTALVKYLQTRNEQVTGKENLWASNWALFGIFVEACFVGAKSRSLQPIKGVFSGLRKAKQGFIGLKFINLR